MNKRVYTVEGSIPGIHGLTECHTDLQQQVGGGDYLLPCLEPIAAPDRLSILSRNQMAAVYRRH
jgi:hypothetical protein